MINSIVSQFEAQVSSNPQAVAVAFQNKSWSYYKLNNYANFISQLLISRGVTESAVIAVSGTKSVEMIAAIISILKLKCTYMPIDLSLPSSYVKSVLANAKVNYVLSNGTNSHQLQEITCIDLKYEDFDSSIPYKNLEKMISPDDAAYIMHTSGSTGIPKGIIVPHRGVLRLVIETNYINLSDSDSVLFHSNTSFDAGIFEIWSALLNGARIVISDALAGDLPTIFKLCQETKITVLLLATGLFHIFSTMDLEKLTHLRYLVVGGDVMRSSAAARAINKNKRLKIINGYGPAENAVFTTCLVIENEKDITNPVSIGQPINGTAVYLLDENLNEVKQGEIGEIYVSGEGVALGYINAPEITQEKFLKINHISSNQIFYRTGDMAKILPSGNFEFIGRQDNQVKIRGFRIELTEIENVISGLDFVEDVCVSTTNNPDKKIIAYVKVAHFAGSDLQGFKTKIVSFLKRQLPSYSIPSFLEISEEFPLTRNGKIDRNQLQARFFFKDEKTKTTRLSA